MVKVKAKIIKFEESERGKYHPIFEYQHNGQTLTYKRKKPMEETPFNRNKEYTLFINNDIIFEKTENMPELISIISIGIMMMLFSIFVSMFPEYGSISMAIFPIIVIFLLSWSVFCTIKLNHFNYGAESIDGTIVDFRKLTRSKSGTTYHHYFPIIEYHYQGKKYFHMSRKPLTRLEALNKKDFINKNRAIYIKNEIVHDEKELKNSITTEIYVILAMLVLLAVTIIIGLKPIMGEVAYYEFIIELINNLTPFKIQ